MDRTLILLTITLNFIRSVSVRNAIVLRQKHSFRRQIFKMSSESTSSKFKQSKKFKNVPYEYHQEVEIEIDDLSNLGLGIGRHNGWVIMVPLVIPGERAIVRIFKNNADYSEGDLVRITRSSEFRVEPKCKYFEECGGCQYQHMNVESQRTWKRNQVIQLLTRIGKLENITVNPAKGSDDYYGYRSKITPHYDSLKSVSDLKIGFQQRGTNRIIDIEECIIATNTINEKYAQTRCELGEKFSETLPKKGATLLFRDCTEGVVTDFRATITQRVKELDFKFKAGEFFQNNPYVLPLMVDHVIEQARGHGCNFVIDAYCGSGLFALCSAQHFTKVIGVEVSELAVEAASNNAKLNNILNASFICGSAEAIFSNVADLEPAQTVVIIDPPRKGCDDVFLQQLFKFHPKKVVYVSCDPATQARDAKDIVKAGYSILDVTPFDLFPQTRHIENVITFLKD